MISAAVRSGTVGSSPARLEQRERPARRGCVAAAPRVTLWKSTRTHVRIIERSQRPPQRSPGPIPPLLVRSSGFRRWPCGDCLTSGTVEPPARVGLPPAVAARESGRVTASLEYFAGAGQGNQSRNRVVFRRNEDEPIAVLSVPHAGLQENLEAGGVKEGEVG